MNVLGISGHFHDAAAALLVDQQLIAAAAEERFSRVKHDAHFPKYAARFCLEQAELSVSDLDAVVFYENPATKFTRVLASTLAPFPMSLGPFVRAMKGWLSHKLFLRNELSRQLDVHPQSVHFVTHHQSHAAHAFYTSPFERSAIITVDAVGEWECSSIWVGDRSEGLRQVDSIEYPHSLGLLYAAVTAFLGFLPNSGECSTMALSTFGEPRYVEDFEKMVQIQQDGSYVVDSSYFEFLSSRGLPLSSKFTTLFGDPAEPGFLAEIGLLDALDDATPLPKSVQHYADIAASLQVVLEKALLALANRAKELTQCESLCFAGGVALNCVANTRLANEAPFEQLFIPTDPGDGGGAMGAAMAFCQGGRGGDTPYLGKVYNESAMVEMVPFVEEDVWNCVGPGAATTRAPRAIRVESFDDDQALVQRTVDMLMNESVVGWVQGRFENGPRALGNRSLLAHPAKVELARKISQKIKLRAPFRPYSFSVADTDASKVLEAAPSGASMAWMQYTQQVKSEYQTQLRAASHVDGSTRPQVCAESDNPLYFQLLTEFGRASGVGALLNTSLNERGAPMVASPVEALAMFARSEMDAIVVGRSIIRKDW